jgi:hypothetical protein
MRYAVWPNARNLDTKIGIPRTQISWLLTLQYSSM